MGMTTTTAADVMCSCHKYQARGCWEHSHAEARLINAYRLGFDDFGVLRKPETPAYIGWIGGVGHVRIEAKPWPEDEIAWYEAGSALASGKYREVTV